MAEIIILAAAALLMIHIYSRTEYPKLTAFINTVVGIACLFGVMILTGGLDRINYYNTALAVILGAPGAVLAAVIGFLV
ncbi:MAG: hypothetical protein ACI4J4_08670 [Ruminiclostridium sp.]